MLTRSLTRLPRSPLLNRATLVPRPRAQPIIITQAIPQQLLVSGSPPPLQHSPRFPYALPPRFPYSSGRICVGPRTAALQPARQLHGVVTAAAASSGQGPAMEGADAEVKGGDAGAAEEAGASPRTRARRATGSTAAAPKSGAAAKKGARSRAAEASAAAAAPDGKQAGTTTTAEKEAAAETAAGSDADAPPAAKRARTGRQTNAQHRSKAAAAAAAAASADADAGADEPGNGQPDAAAAAAAAPKAKPKGKKGPQKAEPLPQYTAALRKPPPPEGTPQLRVLSWNVAGLRALLKKQPDALSRLVSREGVDVVCLQEHKLQGGHTQDMEAALGLQGWTHHWACSTAKLGYSGVSIHTRTPPLAVTSGLGPASPGAAADPDPEHEVEGRLVTAELAEVVVVSVYVPNSGEGLKRLDYRVKRWDGALAAYLRGLEARGKPVIVTGDLNCAHQEIDIHAPKTNLRSAGFTVEERESFGRLLLGQVGLVDSFRRLHPGTVGYTYFTRRFNCREQNKGWRLDYFLTSGALMPDTGSGAAAAAAGTEEPKAGEQAAAAEAAAAAAGPTLTPALTQWRVYDSWILQDVYGSDHLPLGLTLVKEAQ